MKLVFDIGGTKFRYAVSKDSKKIDFNEVRKTPEQYDEAMSIFTQIIGKYKKTGISGICIGIAGMFDSQREKLIYSPNLPDWEERDVKKDIASLAFQDPSKIFLENDAAVAGLGEAIDGSGKEFAIVAYLTVGTGVGGCRIVEKKIDRKVYGFEPGHMIIDENNNSDLESLVSGSGLKRKYGISSEHIKDADIWNNVERSLSVGIYNLLLLWSPEVIVLGGGLIEGNVINIEKVRHKVMLLNKTIPEIPEFRKSQLSDKAGLFGALNLQT